MHSVTLPLGGQECHIPPLVLCDLLVIDFSDSLIGLSDAYSIVNV